MYFFSSSPKLWFIPSKQGGRDKALCKMLNANVIKLYAFFPVYSQVGWHPQFTDSRCFFIIRTDGTVEDFSYRKCIIGALDIVDPEKSKIQKKKWSGNNDMEAKKWLGNDDMGAKKGYENHDTGLKRWSESYDLKTKKWWRSDDLEDKKWSRNYDMEANNLLGNYDMEANK